MCVCVRVCVVYSSYCANDLKTEAENKHQSPV